MNYYYGIAWLLGLLLFQSPLYTQSVNLDSFEKVQLVKLENCAVVQINASWNYKNRLAIEKLKDCYIAEVDLANRQIGAVIQKEWKVKDQLFLVRGFQPPLLNVKPREPTILPAPQPPCSCI